MGIEDWTRLIFVGDRKAPMYGLNQQSLQSSLGGGQLGGQLGSRLVMSEISSFPQTMMPGMVDRDQSLDHEQNMRKIYQWINELTSPETRETALLELSKMREKVEQLAPMLWLSSGYPAIFPSSSYSSLSLSLPEHKKCEQK